MPDQIWEPPVWEDPKIIWTPPDYPHVALVKITTPHDLTMWAMYMGHSGARYQKWAIDTPIWDFYTFLDEEGWPHVTIHAKNTEWLYKAHPDDGQAMGENKWEWGFGPSPRDLTGKAKFWLRSTLYDSVDLMFDRPCIVDNKRVVIMGAGHRDRDLLWGGEKKLVQEWYDTVVIPGSRPVENKWRR